MVPLLIAGRSVRQEARDRFLVEQMATHAVREARGDADVGDADHPGQLATRVRQEPDLGEAEGHRSIGLHRDAEAPSGVAVHAARHVDGDADRGAAVHRGEDGRELPLDVLAEAGSEHGVHDHLGAGEVGLGGAVADLDDLAAELFVDREMQGRLAALAGPTFREQHAGMKAALAEPPRADEAVAAVVSGAAHHGHLGMRRGDHGHLVGDGAAGVLHEQRRRQTDLVDRVAIEPAHLGGGDEAHRAGQCTRASMSRTARSSPTNTARETIEWPMFSSSIPPSLATGPTLG